ncbi:uncharacterized protein LOC118484350 isoform X2 [Helianthus annuus]|nr:uncharacterized protein LOC118484350 isoform X2 [Helianthus annuus]
MTTTIPKFAHLQIPLEDVLNATNNFHDDNIIGRGGFGPAYKGQLQRSGKLIKIAARRLDRTHGEGHVEFWTEISALSDLKHTNLVSIVGFCNEKDEKIIITTYAANGSLREHLNNPNLTWTQRLRISVGVARALSYLHYDEGRGYGFIHRNVNSSTILLDEKWEAKLSGFEISIKQAVNRMDQITLSEPIGTIGYVDPEIEKSKGVTCKSDIYAFGVVLFEILCGRRAYIKNDANRLLATLVMHHYEKETLPDIIHPDLKNQMSRHQISIRSLRIYSETAFSCLKEERSHRPHIFNIVNELEKALEKALKFQPRPENFGNNLEHLKIELHDIKLATHNFSDTNKTNSSKCYTWYTVELRHFAKENPSFIEGISKSKLFKRHDTFVIKRFLPEDDEFEEELFFTELEVLANVKHHNIVSLIGFCVEGFERILVTEKLSIGFLGNCLGDVREMRNLTWEKRLKICIDGAHALNYLHYEMDDKKVMIHSHIDSFKFGLDENGRAKIEDFEFAVFLPPNQEDETLCKRTYFRSKYHVDPEYAKIGKLKRESDVYSFGVVLFEILCGREAGDQIYLKESEKGLVHVARRNFYNGTIEDVIDPTLKEETGKKICNPINKDSLYTFLKVADQCVAETQDQRPTMKVVLKELQKALVFQVIQEEQVHEPNMDQVVDELQITTFQTPVNNLEHLKIPLTHILSATSDFSYTYRIAILDDVQFYRAELEHYDKENHSSKRQNTVIIKRYPSDRRHQFSGEKQFLTEIEILSGGVKHPNIVTMLGFCVEASEMILVIDNFSNGFLDDYLENLKEKRVLTWEKRLKICIDVAHGLHYIHSQMEDQKMIINRDICSYKIGLDENQGAKIVEFGESIVLPLDQKDEALYLQCIGAEHYIDPEYKKTNKVKRESDVYGFGVILFEILCGRLANDPIYLKESDIGLAHVARRSFSTGSLEELIDPIIKEEVGENNFVLNRGPNKDSLHRFITIAHQCVAETQDQRPKMEVVVNELEKALFFQKNNNDIPRMSLEDIKQATQNFHNDNCIGRGGFGKVHKGNFQDGDGFKTIVAKRLDSRFGQGEQQFLSELQILLDFKHESVIGLVGFCDENDEKIIIYEYASKGSLDRYLNDVSLTWEKRLDICIDVARALDFLHGGVGKQAKVIHRDIKTANILLKDEWKAKLADFGLSLVSPLVKETDYVIDHVCGTTGYLDPLYRKLGFLTIESDIYSFGVVLFEILCGRSTFEIKKHEGHYLPDFIEKSFKEGKHGEVVFKQIREQIVPKSLITFQEIAYQCLHLDREKRPTTKKVLMQLKKALVFQNMSSTMNQFAHLQIPLEDVAKATNNFHHDNIIEHDGVGIAYKGRLLWSGRLMEIAARRFDCKRGEGDLKILTEISVLSDLKHKNLVSVIGFCDEIDEKIIVTTYDANGSLGQYLNSLNLTWKQRLRICLGVARALSYLHYGKGRDYAILHCNINSKTILLDDNWETKLSGFEFSIKQSVNDKDQVCPCEHTGTLGCEDPAIEKTGGVTHKSDIYSFGVVLFETLCMRKALIQNEADWSLAQLAKYHHEKGTLHDIIHPHLLNQILSPQALLIYSKVAYSCLNDDRAHRPDTHYIVAILEKALELQLRHENIENKFGHLKIHLNDIKLATNNFSETYTIASVDGECTLYRAELHCFDKENPSSEKGKNKGDHPKGHNIVVIKRYPSGSQCFGEEEFFTEIEMLSSVEHPNIVTLIGFCIEDSEMILVIENVSNGYLWNYLGNDNDMRILTWEKRLKICIDVANALEHLHSEMEDQKMIIHRDICRYNIGLDENWRAKIDGFVACVFLPPNQEDEAVYIKWRGRTDYIDPEYEKTDKLKRESDVYSFGVVLFEILCGRRAYDPIYTKENGRGLGPVAKQSFCMGTLESMIDPILKEETGENNFVLNKGPNKDSLHTFMKIAYQCVAETQDQRPTMKVVVKELEKALSFQLNSEVKSDYVEEKSHASIIETQVVELSNELNSMNMTGKSENFEIHNKENMLHDQTDDSAEPDC